MPTRTEVETLRAKISGLRDVLDVAMGEVTRLQAENWELKRRLHRKWNGRTHVWHCPTCGGFAKLETAAVDMADRILYVQCYCKRCHAVVTPAKGYTVDNIKEALG